MSIITEALKKAEKERSKPADSKEYLDKIVGPQINMGSDISYEYTEPAATKIDWRKNRPLIVSGVLIVGAIVFLSVMNVFILSSVDTETAQPAYLTRRGADPIEAETYTTVMRSDISRIERQRTILDKMSMAIKGITVKDELVSNFTLNGIIYDADNSWAIINNKMVKAGEVLDGAKVLAISPQKVAVLFKNEVFDLTVK